MAVRDPSSGSRGSRDANDGANSAARCPQARRVVVDRIEVPPVVEAQPDLRGQRLKPFLFAALAVAERDPIRMRSDQVVDRTRAADAVVPLGEQVHVMAARRQLTQGGLEVTQEPGMVDGKEKTHQAPCAEGSDTAAAVG
jgi:hypothetical protein